MREKTGVDDGIRTRSKSFTDSGANRYTTSTIKLVPPRGIEPLLLIPQTRVLSIIRKR